MVGIIVMRHGAMAQEALKSAEMLVGSGEAVAAGGVFPGDTPDDVFARAEALFAKVDSGAGVVALVDLYGGTPNNVMFRLKQAHNVRILTGFNLPMLIYAITERQPETTQDELMQGLKSVGTAEIREFGKT